MELKLQIALNTKSIELNRFHSIGLFYNIYCDVSIMYELLR